MLAACGGADPSGGDLADPSAAADLAPAPPDLAPAPPDLAPAPPDLAPGGSGFVCGNASCAPSSTCCVTQSDAGVSAACQPSCGAGSVPVECSGPQHCGGNPCCLTLDQSAPQSTLCTSTPDACAPRFDASGSGQTRVCRTSADCAAGLTQPSYPDCCTTTRQGVTARFCFNKGLVPYVMNVSCP